MNRDPAAIYDGFVTLLKNLATRTRKAKQSIWMMLLTACHFDGHRPQPGVDNSWAKGYWTDGADSISPKPVSIGTPSKKAVPIETGLDSPNWAKGYYT